MILRMETTEEKDKFFFLTIILQWSGYFIEPFRNFGYLARLTITAGERSMIGKIFKTKSQICLTQIIVTGHISHIACKELSIA